MLIARVGIGFFRAQALLSLVLVGVFVVLNPPELRGVTAGQAASSAGTADTASLEGPASGGADAAPRTRAIVDVRLGPGGGYAVVGLLPRASEIEVVGRDETGDWLAVLFVPGSTLRGWIERTSVTNLPDVSALPVASVTRLSTD